jgi:hypothetical protein
LRGVDFFINAALVVRWLSTAAEEEPLLALLEQSLVGIDLPAGELGEG